LGTTMLPLLAWKRARNHFLLELRNFQWAVASEVLTFMAVGTMYAAMSVLPATIVSSFGSVQPLVVLFGERAVQGFYRRMSADHAMMPKLGAIILIVIGVVLLMLSQTNL